VDEIGRRRGEDDWFKQNEHELLEAARLAREKRQKAREAAEREEDRKRLRELHYLKCPKCGHDMKPEDLLGIEVDRCSFCEGVFFDIGELEDVFNRKMEDRKSIWRKLLKL
jgi:hypothetical protein